MILTGLAAFVTGAAEFFLDVPLFDGVFRGKFGRVAALLLTKLGLYALGFTLLFLFAKRCYIGAAIGFGAGFFPALLIWGVLQIRKTRGEDT